MSCEKIWRGICLLLLLLLLYYYYEPEDDSQGEVQGEEYMLYVMAQNIVYYYLVKP